LRNFDSGLEICVADSQIDDSRLRAAVAEFDFSDSAGDAVGPLLRRVFRRRTNWLYVVRMNLGWALGTCDVARDHRFPAIAVAVAARCSADAAIMALSLTPYAIDAISYSSVSANLKSGLDRTGPASEPVKAAP
jgi:hypothetical protein